MASTVSKPRCELKKALFCYKSNVYRSMRHGNTYIDAVDYLLVDVQDEN